VEKPVRCRFVPQSPAGFVGNVTTPVGAGEPSAECFDEPSPRQLAQQRCAASPGASCISWVSGFTSPLDRRLATPLRRFRRCQFSRSARDRRM